ncbi:MAG: NrpR regulatory domain-containing protein [Candidatus Omnitrophota bacterium]
MKDFNQKQKMMILRILRDAKEPIGSAAIAEEMKNYGFDLCGRTIRLYLQEMEKEGVVTSTRRGRDGGRAITPQGLEEIHDAMVNERVGFMAGKMDALACQMTFNPASRNGLVVVNVTIIDRTHLVSAAREMMPVFRAKLGMGDYIVLARAGEQLGGFYIPPGKVGVGTMCSVTINGLFLAARIPMTSVFGGVLEINEGRPFRFTDLIYYNGTSLDPLEIFIKGKLTSVREAARTGHGRIGASMREVPSPAFKKLEKLRRQLDDLGLGGGLFLGKPHQSLLDFPIEEGRMGLIVTGGLNPLAAVEEAGIPTANYALASLIDFEKMIHYKELPHLIEQEEF